MSKSCKSWIHLVLGVALAVGLAVPAVAFPPPGPPPGKPGPAGGGDDDKPDFPKLEDVTKGFEKVKPSGIEDGAFLTLWYNKKTDSLLAQIPAGLIGQRFLIASSISGGPSATGFQLDHWVAYLERMDKMLVLMRVDPRYAADANQPVADVVKRSYTDEIVRPIPIRTMAGGDPVVDFNDLFKGDFAGVGNWLGGGANSMLSKWVSYKAFPQNVELSVDMAVGGRGPAAGGRRMRMHYSLSSIPQSDYKPRVADPRVGYFTTVRYDWGKKYDAKTLFNRYINRWNLKKQDPTLELSPTATPITWYIEQTVPIRWRRYVREGIEEWNKAYEKCGFANAVQVLQQEKDNDAARYDPEDVRYNFFRWIVTGRGFAMGPSRDHPLTGEILDADIVFDDAMVRHYVTEYERMTAGAPQSWEAFNPYLNNFFRAHPQWAFRPMWTKLMPDVQIQNDPEAEFREKLDAHMHDCGRPLCDYSAGMGHQLALMRIEAEAKGLTPTQNEEFLGQIVKEVVMHEVGHCLGLRHNFKASSWKPMADVEASNSASEATVGSVMDYNPTIFAVRGEKQSSYAPRTLGPYDFWAIEYGYKAPGKEDKGEDEMLKKIASRGAEAGLDYATDEDTLGVLSPDPLVNRFDMGKDPIAYAERQIKLCASLLKDVTKWDVKDGESYSELRRTFRRLVAEKARVASFVARFVGGQYMNRDHKGDPNARPPIVPVEPDKQRAARDFVVKNVFAPDAYQFDAELLEHLAPGRWSHWNSDDFDFQQDFNIHDFVSGGQYACLFTLMNPFTIGRIHDSETMAGKDGRYTLAEHVKSITDAIWSELEDAPKAKDQSYINSFRRNLQRMQLGMLLNLVLSDPGSDVPADANAIARMTVSELSEKIGGIVGNGSLDGASKAHLLDCKKRIDKALEAEYMVGGGGGGVMFLFGRPAEQGKAQEPISVLPTR